MVERRRDLFGMRFSVVEGEKAAGSGSERKIGNWRVAKIVMKRGAGRGGRRRDCGALGRRVERHCRWVRGRAG